MAANTRTPQEVNAEILGKLDVLAEYRAMGVEIVGEPRASGMASCRAYGRDDRRPSAFINKNTGIYGDSGGGGAAAYTLSLWEFAATKAGKFPDWKEARKAFAAKAGVTLGKESGGKASDWRVKLDLEPWSTPGNDMLAMRFCLKVKRGLTVEAIKAAGGMLGYYPLYIDKKTGERKKAPSCRQVVAIPAYGQYGLAADPVAWVIWNVDGSEFDTTPREHPKNEKRITSKMLSVGPTAGTYLGLAGLMALSDPDGRQQIEWIYKVEGPADMLALMAAISASTTPDLAKRHIVVTNGGGATADVSQQQAKLLAGLRVAVVGDCDEAGQVGAAKWSRALDGISGETRSVRLPWPIKPKRGEDVRDYLTGLPLPCESPPTDESELKPRAYADLFSMVESTPAWAKPAEGGVRPAVEPASAGGEDQSGPPPNTVNPTTLPNQQSEPTTKQIDTFEDQKVANALQIDVLGRTTTGDIRVYSEFLARTVDIKNVAKIKYEDLLSAFGTPVRKCILRSSQDEAPGFFTLTDAREALAHLGSFRVVSDEVTLGMGVWPCFDANAEHSETGDINALVLVNSSEAAHFNGEFLRITHPRHKESLLDFDTSAKPWYEFDQLRDLLQAADDQQFRNTVIDDLVNLFGRWRWKSGHDPVIATGLVLATWVQSLWAWRPRIDVLGASNTGKSMLCAALAGIFNGLVILTSDTTAAGLRQKIANRMLAVVVDEVDAKNKTKMARQREILEMLRSASRGTAAIRGSGNQKAVEFTLRHLVWVAGITLTYDDAADRNRAIMLNLLPPLPEMAGKLVLPTNTELIDIGRRSLAAALWAIRAARLLAVQLKDTKIPGADPRIVESYAVPASMISVVGGHSTEIAAQFLAEMLADAKSDVPVESDEANLIAEILQATVVMERFRLTVGQAIKHVLDLTSSNRDEWRMVLEGAGIRVGVSELVVNYGAVRSKLLRGTRWDGQPIDQTLRRIPGCKSSQQSIGGVKSRGVRFPLEDFVRNWIGTNEADDPQKEF